MLKKENGITLIALVITIIVLLILAGVSIAMLTGENGVLTKASDATTKTKEAEVEEAIKLVVAEIIADNEGFPSGGITDSLLTKAKLENMNSNYTFAVEVATNYLTVTATSKSGDTIITRYVNTKTGAVSETNS